MEVLLEKDLELKNQDLVAKNNLSLQEIEGLREKINQIKGQQDKQIQQVNRQHQKKLEEIDDKIRKIIQAKNKEISQLQQQVLSQQQRYQELEETLNELNRNLASIK